MSTQYQYVSRDILQKRTTKGFAERVGGSISGVPIGVILAAGSCALLWWNEGSAFNASQSLSGMKNKILSILSFDPQNEGLLVHYSGNMTSALVNDPQLVSTATIEESSVPMAMPVTIGEDETLAKVVPVVHISLQRKVLCLKRIVQMYQWVEKVVQEKTQKLGGTEETVETYKYLQEWSEKHHDSSKFEMQRDHVNPEFLSVRTRSFEPSWLHIGPFSVSESLAAQIPKQAHVPHCSELYDVEARVSLRRQGDWYMPVGNGRVPCTGDTRVRFEAAMGGALVSVVGRQMGRRLVACPGLEAAGGGLLLEQGAVPPEVMLSRVAMRGRMLVWVLRALGVAGMYGGFKAMLNPLSTAASLVPMLSTFVGATESIVAVEGAFALGGLTIISSYIHARGKFGVVKAMVKIVYVLLVAFLSRKIYLINLAVASATARAAKGVVAGGARAAASMFK